MLERLNGRIGDIVNQARVASASAAELDDTLAHSVSRQESLGSAPRTRSGDSVAQRQSQRLD